VVDLINNTPKGVEECQGAGLNLSLFWCEELRGPMDNQGICLGPWVHELQGQKQLHSRQWTKQNAYRVAGIFSKFCRFFLEKKTPRPVGACSRRENQPFTGLNRASEQTRKPEDAVDLVLLSRGQGALAGLAYVARPMFLIHKPPPSDLVPQASVHGGGNDQGPTSRIVVARLKQQHFD
jgi:hypothetical protein